MTLDYKCPPKGQDFDAFHTKYFAFLLFLPRLPVLRFRFFAFSLLWSCALWRLAHLDSFICLVTLDRHCTILTQDSLSSSARKPSWYVSSPAMLALLRSMTIHMSCRNLWMFLEIGISTVALINSAYFLPSWNYTSHF